jgi:starvation-inducible DNA-binding protein
MARTDTITFSTRNDLQEHLRINMITLLNQQLADTFDLYSQVKQAHWNVKGMNFMQLHRLFDELAASLSESADMLAERATALGGMAMGTARMAAAHSQLPEYPADVVVDRQVVEVLVQRYGDYSASTRAAIDNAAEHGDQSTADLFTELSRMADKHLWFLEAHLQVET